MARNQSSGAESGGAASPDRYEVRRYRPADVEDVLALDETVWDRDRAPAWFRWKYERNPYVDEPPVFVAERDGEIVGARPLMAFRLRAGRSTETRLALQPADTMVHPDHRRQGLFTRMTELAIETYRGGHPGLFFNWPNSQSRPGYEKLGWRTVRPQVTHHRVARPGAFLDGSVAELLDRGAGPAIKGYARANEAFAGPDADADVAVERAPGAPIDRLSALYDRLPPARVHARRTPAFLAWRLGSPEWDRTTYVAVDRGGADVAAVVARTRSIESGAVVTQVADTLPLVGGARWRSAVDDLLSRVLADHPETDLFSVATDALPRDLLAAHGFLPDDRLPLSRLASREKTLAIRPFDPGVGDGAWRIGDLRVDSADNWHTSFLERDTT